MFRFMRDTDPQDPAMFLMDPFALHRQHMRRMFSGNFGMSPFLSLTDGSVPALPRSGGHRDLQAGALSPFGMMGMGGGFMDMFSMMNDLMGGMVSTYDAAEFDEEWQRGTSRYRNQRGVGYRRRGGPEEQLAIQGPEDSTIRPSRRYDW
ncbi:hypothetical protein GDO81_030216 [Engystomops pustulosus]|uniref:Myeloid leukemia factor 2 n=1 Tax=Engystomops pustulosus TaxID=76066 RepID=A0AAV6ZB35_ENGPU|nr:hypothetical protein GDO81_030216 [Engystomops pustulosus]